MFFSTSGAGMKEKADVGCFRETCSSGNVLAGTAISPTPRIGLPLLRSST